MKCRAERRDISFGEDLTSMGVCEASRATLSILIPRNLLLNIGMYMSFFSSWQEIRPTIRFREWLLSLAPAPTM